MRHTQKRACLLGVLLCFVACSEGLRGGPVSQQQNVSGQAVKTSPDSARRAGAAGPVNEDAPVYGYEIVQSWPHDRNAFTQGLIFYQGSLYESTGQYGSSSLRKVELESGKVKKKIDVPSNYFAEGMTIFDGKVFQLTWKAQKGFVYDLKSFKKEGEFSYQGEGWGLTHDTQALIMSDGSNQIRFLNPKTFEVERTISVYDHDGQPLMELNELELIKGELYANIWHSDRIVRLDPTNGHINAWIDLKGLRLPEDATNDDNVLNGIAYDEAHDRLFITGKRWSKIFEVRLKKQ